MRQLWVLILVLGAIFVSLLSCEKNDETKISSHGSSESHNGGQNCMSCHKDGESGEGWFTAAGTVYISQKENEYPNTTVKLYTGAESTGSLISTIEGDALGNFYTTENIDFGTGLYVSVEGATNINYMVGKVTSGQCNKCHGVSTDKIWTE